MTAARLSPAANLLRNSRLFALPSPIALPIPDKYHEDFQSDTATTVYPTLAALETPKPSLVKGDWGLKRALPIRTTTKSGTPTFRIRGGIDTREHIADFESAADHVITLRKFQELNTRVTLPEVKGSGPKLSLSSFTPERDNTTEDPLPDISPSNGTANWLLRDESQGTHQRPRHLEEALKQYEEERAANAESGPQRINPTPTALPSSFNSSSKRRWRYSGPYLAGITELEFNIFLEKITAEKKAQFRQLVKDHLISERIDDQRAAALDQGSPQELSQTSVEVTEDDITQHLRYLRSEPGKFGPLIARFFDLADGPSDLAAMDAWAYGRDTTAAGRFRDTGPPRTHPSAGLSYQQSGKSVVNDVEVGPLAGQRPAPARLLQSSLVDSMSTRPQIGVAGFVATIPGINHQQNLTWEPMQDGPKCVVNVETTTIKPNGMVDLTANVKIGWHLENNKPVSDADRKDYVEQISPAALSGSTQTPYLRRSRGAKVEPDNEIIAALERRERSSFGYDSNNHV